MPPRWLCWIIVGSWLATTGWLFWRDLWPRWAPGEPPTFQIDDVEEVQQKGNNRLVTRWIVERQVTEQSKPYLVFHATTWVDYHKEEDEYTLNAELKASKDPKTAPIEAAELFQVASLTSAYRVNRSGQLRSLEATAKVHVDKKSRLGKLLLHEQTASAQNSPSTEPISLSIFGEIRDHHFFAHCRVVLPSLNTPLLQFDLPPTPVSYTGSVLMPLHPVSHIRGLRPGQSWRQPLVDPLRDALAKLPGFSGDVHWLNAQVRPGPEVLELNGVKTNCLVIEYTNDDNERIGRTWVEQDSERVLQQEVFLEGGRWIMKRELTRRSHFRFMDS